MATGNQIEDAMMKKLTAKIASEIDFDAMAKRLAPKIAKAIEANIIRDASKMELQDWVYDAMNGRDFGEVLKKHLLDVLKKGSKK